MKNGITYLDRAINDYIQNNEGEYYDDVIANDTRQEIHNALSSKSTSLINWYPFRDKAAILQVQAGFGTLTGTLCDIGSKVTVIESSKFRAEALHKRYHNRHNLEIQACSIDTITSDEHYDYIVVTDLEVIEQGDSKNNVYVEYLQYLQQWLKPFGKILIAVENRYGISNWCGKREVHTGIAFNGIAGYPEEAGAKSFHRKQIEMILEDANLVNYKFFYPMPTLHSVSDVFSDSNLPDVSCIENLKECFTYDLSSVFSVDCVLKDVIINGTFPFFTNIFFVEASKSKETVLTHYDKILKSNLVNVHFGKKDASLKDKMLKNMAANRRLLSSKGHTNILEDDKDVALIQQVIKVQLDLLQQLEYVCKKHGLQLYMIYGTLLGAVRHGGVIPGDDDIDVALLRDDYNKLLELTDEFQGEYFLQTPWNDNAFFGGYLKLRNRNTTAIHPQNWWVNCCEGIGIDIFPLDNGYPIKIQEWWKEKRVCFYQRMLYAKAYGYFKNFKDMPLLIWKIYRYLGKIFSRKVLADRMNEIMGAGEDTKKAPFGIYAHYMPKSGIRKLNRTAFNKKVTIQYEDMLLCAPADYDKILTQTYGKGYMQCSTFIEGKTRHGFYSVSVPYNQYKTRFVGLFRPLDTDKDIVLIGDELMFEEYFRYYKFKYIPKILVVASEKINKQQIEGIKVKTLDFLDTLNKSEIYLVVCGVDIRKIEEHISKMGFVNYHIFVSDRNWLLLENVDNIMKQVAKKSSQKHTI